MRYAIARDWKGNRHIAVFEDAPSSASYEKVVVYDEGFSYRALKNDGTRELLEWPEDGAEACLHVKNMLDGAYRNGDTLAMEMVDALLDRINFITEG